MTATRISVAMLFAVMAASPAARIQRDATERARIGTASIAGVVVTNETVPQPVRRAIVSLQGGDSSLGRHAITDDEGRFAFDALPAGRYAASASKRAFVTIPFGAVRAGQAGAPIIIESGQRLENVRLVVARGAAITGTVRDATGEPIAGLDVRVEARSAVGTARPLAVVAQTDDQGVYRAFGLPAGSYFVSTRPRITGRADLVARSDEEVDAALRELKARPAGATPASAGQPSIRNIESRTPARPVDFVPVFHPSAFSQEDAAILTLAAGDERAGVDITVRMLSTAAIAGRILNMGDRSPTEIEVTVSKPGQSGPPVGAFRTIARTDGSFRVAGVTPGRYLLVVRALSSSLMSASLGKPGQDGASMSSGSCAFAAEQIEVTGDDVSGISLTLRPCLRIEGRVELVTDGQAGSAASLSGLVVSLQPDAASRLPMYVPIRVPATLGKESRFTLGEFGDVLPGSYHLNMTLSGSETERGWWLQSGTVEGRDILDSPLAVGADSPSSIPVILTFTNQHTSLSGSLEILSQRLPVEYTVIVFPTNREWWSAPFRRVKAARAAPTGQYAIHDLPPGEYFLAALSDLAPDEWRDRDFLDLIVPAAIRLTIGPGEQKTQTLRIAR